MIWASLLQQNLKLSSCFHVVLEGSHNVALPTELTAILWLMRIRLVRPPDYYFWVWPDGQTTYEMHFIIFGPSHFQWGTNAHRKKNLVDWWRPPNPVRHALWQHARMQVECECEPVCRWMDQGSMSVCRSLDILDPSAVSHISNVQKGPQVGHFKYQVLLNVFVVQAVLLWWQYTWLTSGMQWFGLLMH